MTTNVKYLDPKADLTFRTLMEGRYDEGVQAGANNKAIEIAKKMKSAGMDENAISEMTGLPIEEISSL